MGTGSLLTLALYEHLFVEYQAMGRSAFSDDRLALLRRSEDFGGGTTERARVFRTLIDEFMAMRRQLRELTGDDD